MTEPRPTITLFRKVPKSEAVLPIRRAVRQIPIRYVSREAVERLVAKLTRSTIDAE